VTLRLMDGGAERVLLETSGLACPAGCRGPRPEATFRTSRATAARYDHRGTGTDCYVMKVVLASIDHLQTLLNKLVLWGSPVTSIVISSPVPGRGIQRGLGPTEDGG
jgi:hypothetical protein